MIKIKHELNRLLEDKTSGSIDILFKLNKLIKNNIGDADEIIKFLSDREKNFLSFAAVVQYLERIKKLKSNPQKLREFIISIENSYKNKYYRLYKNASKILLPISKFLTISNSRTIYEIINIWFRDKRNLKAVVCESRPNCEGKILTKKFLLLGIKTELITEAMLAEKIPQVDAVIMGADTITKAGDVYNKVGSKAAAIIAHYCMIPTYVFVTKDKLRKDNNFENKFGEDSEIWKFKHTGLKIDNKYFEKIERKLITKIITD
jgi:translation initiation factor 2B subunit (eIF-2B alpha/beta/delta family)